MNGKKQELEKLREKNVEIVNKSKGYKEFIEFMKDFKDKLKKEQK